MHYSLFHFSISRSLVVDSRIFQILFCIKSSKASSGILPFGRVAAQLLCFGSTAQQKWLVRSFIFSFRHKSFHKHFSDHTDYMALRTNELYYSEPLGLDTEFPKPTACLPRRFQERSSESRWRSASSTLTVHCLVDGESLENIAETVLICSYMFL